MNDIKHTSEEIKQVEKRVATEFARSRDSAYARFPLLFTMLGTFGVVATFYGFEHLIDSIPLLAENPAILLGLGIFTLAVTGTLYRKLG